MTVPGRRLLGYLLLPICIAEASAPSRVILRYVDFGKDIAEDLYVQVVAADRAGNLFNVGRVTFISGRQAFRVIKTDINGNTLASFDLNNNEGQNSVFAAATDPQGNLIITGFANTADFPLVSPLFPSAKIPGVFVMKLDSQLHSIMFSTLLSANNTTGAVATDASGNIYIAGGTSSANFPITPGAYQTKPPGLNATYGGQNSYAFLTEISPNGDRLLYSTYFGGDSVFCMGGSSCLFQAAHTFATALALAPSGAIVMAGDTISTDLPVTPGTLATSCNGSTDLSPGFIAEFAPNGARLKWSTCLNPTGSPIPFSPPIWIQSIALDTAENVLVAGGAAAGGFPTTPGVVQPTFVQNSQLPWAGFIAKLNSTGARLLWSTYFGQSVTSMAVDPLGTVTVTGYSDPNLLPPGLNVPRLGLAYVARFSGDGTTLENLYVGPENSTGAAIVLTAAGTFVAEGPFGSLWIESAASGPSLLGAASAASGPPTRLISPTELMSLYGIGIGPQTSLAGRVENGAFTASLGGYQVLFDGVAAPLLYAGPTQINTIVPHELRGQDYTHLQIVGPAGTIDGPTLALRPARPEIFQNSQTGLAAALNEDGSINSPENPAKPGSIVSIFVTGYGTRWSDGQVVTDASRGNLFPAVILAEPIGNSLEVLYAVDAPGLVAGVSQINFRLPKPLPTFRNYGTYRTYDFELQVGDAISRAAEVAVHQ